MEPHDGQPQPPSEPSHGAIARRSFLKQAAVGVTALTIVPRHVLGGDGHTAPSDRLNIAGVGLGGQGTGLIQRFSDHNIVALCDVDDNQAAGAYERFPQAKQYRDFRRMLEKQQ